MDINKIVARAILDKIENNPKFIGLSYTPLYNPQSYNITIMWTESTDLKLKVKYLQYMIILFSDYATYGCIGCGTQDFPYCDPGFPDNLLAQL